MGTKEWVPMPQILKKLSESFVNSDLHSGYYADGGGLYLQVSISGTKSWIYRFSIAGRVRDMGLGSVRDVSLARARTKASEARLVRELGSDPIAQRRAAIKPVMAVQAAGPSFRQFAEEYISSREADWKNEVHRKQWRSSLEKYVYPVIGDLGLAEITTGDVLKIIEPIWREKSETASRVRARVERILAAASVRGFREGNPATWNGHLKEALPKKRKTVPFAALPYAEMPQFFSALRRCEGLAARALELTILSAARTNETLGAEWSEIDWDQALWTIPPGRMKAAREHRVPLSIQAIDIMRAVQLLRGENEFIFPGWKNGRPLSNTAMLDVLERMDRADITVHGFRSTFRDWSGDCTEFPREVAEAALAHLVSDKTEAAYRRGTAVERRRQLMQSWADYCCSELHQEAVR